MVRKCTKVTILKDKKLRERRIEHEKFIIKLGENSSFDKDERVKIISIKTTELVKKNKLSFL